MKRRRGAIAGIVVVVLGVGLWRFTQPAARSELQLTQLTFDPGLTGWPAISSDGRLVAFCSDRDRASNLELYVQAVPGGSPVRLTNTADDESEPAFSPDGASIAFHSSRDGGSIYVAPVHGGLVTRLVVGGHTPRYSPDGHWIAYRDGGGVFLIPAGGGTPRQFHREIPGGRTPVWSPDGKFLMIQGPTGIWIAPVDEGDPQPSGLPDRLGKAGLSMQLPDDANWTADGLVFTARTGTVRNLYRCPLDRGGNPTGEMVRLTDGTESITGAAVAASGRMVFAAERQRFDLWGLALDGDKAGVPYRITDTLAPTALPWLSADGRRLLFNSSRNGFAEVWLKDLVTGQESVVGTGPTGASGGRFLRTSGRVVYHLGNDAYAGGHKLASNAFLEDVDQGEATALVVGARNIDAVSLKDGTRRTILRAPEHLSLSHPRFSADNRWIVFVIGSRISVARWRGGEEISQDEWLPVVEGAVDKPLFAPDGKRIYFMLDRDGLRSIQQIAFDPQAGKAIGEAYPFYQSLDPRLSLGTVNLLALDMTIGGAKMVTILAESYSNIWMGVLVLRP